MIFKIKKTVSVKAPVSRLYNVLADLERYPNFIKNIKKIKILKQSGNKYISRWIIKIDNAVITWREEDKFYDSSLVKFRMLKGDYDIYHGVWQCSPRGKFSELTLDANIELGAPKFLEFQEVNKILERKTKRSMIGMAMAIKKESEKVFNG